MTGDDLIAALQALPPEQRALPVVLTQQSTIWDHRLNEVVVSDLYQPGTETTHDAVLRLCGSD